MEQAAVIGNEATKEKILKEISINGALKLRLKQSLLDTFSVRERTARNVLLRLFQYQILVSRYCVANGMDLKKEKRRNPVSTRKAA